MLRSAPHASAAPGEHGWTNIDSGTETGRKVRLGSRLSGQVKSFLDLHLVVHYNAQPMPSKSPILVFFLAVVIVASPLSGLVRSHAPGDGSSHTHHHFHDGHYHSHQHHHGDDEGGDGDEPSREGDHHSVLDDTPDGAMVSRAASRRSGVAMSVLPPVMAVLTAPVSGDWQHYRRAKPPPSLPPDRSCQAGQLRTIVLLV
ncbi:hypothetical protein MNBD_PLANCTO03-1189 [hydrothermal vent metagenome]|uniref:Uncharacterized protein n=1 Tax=hydrothermal vent metagenome TaxID=652676 RepID=A0A3B1DJP5_9ZZZZ